MGAAVLCSSFMSFGVKRRWFAMAASVQLALSTYASYVGEQVHYGEWLKVSLHVWRSRLCQSCEFVNKLTFAKPPPPHEGPDVFQSFGHHWRLLDSSQRSRGGVQAESSQQVSAVHRTGVPGRLPHLHGECLLWGWGGAVGGSLKETKRLNDSESPGLKRNKGQTPDK